MLLGLGLLSLVHGLPANVSIAISSSNPFGTVYTSLANNFDACPKLAPRSSPATSVRDLRPDDFGLLIGIGDSLMAGLYAGIPYDTRQGNWWYHFTEKVHEYRGVNFATGADPGTFTLAHALLNYNPNLKGVSRGTTDFTFCYGPLCLANTWFQKVDKAVLGLNAAFSGLWTTESNLDHELSYLDEQVPIYSSTFLEEPWKLIIVELGFNNIDLSCVPLINREFNADMYATQMRYFFDRLHSKYTKAYVVVLSPFKMSDLEASVNADPICPKLANQGCLNSKNTAVMDSLAMQYRAAVEEIIKEYQSKYKDDHQFAITYDPGLSELNLKGAKASETFSGYDCFHPNIQSHARLGAGLWSNLFLSDADKKPYDAVGTPELRCLADSDRLWYPNLA